LTRTVTQNRNAKSLSVKKLTSASIIAGSAKSRKPDWASTPQVWKSSISAPESRMPDQLRKLLSASPSPRRSAGSRSCRNVSRGTTKSPAPTPAR